MNAIFSIARTSPFTIPKTAVSLSLRIVRFVKKLFAFLSFQTTRAYAALRHSFDLAYPFLTLVAFIAFVYLLNKVIDDPPPARRIDHRPLPREPEAAREALEVLAIIDRIKAATAHQQERIEELLTAGIGRQYFCSISLEFIRDPVRDPTARGIELVYYERDSITAALRRNAISPHTRQPLTVAQLEEAPPEYFAIRTEALLRTFHEEINAILDRVDGIV